MNVSPDNSTEQLTQLDKLEKLVESLVQTVNTLPTMVDIQILRTELAKQAEAAISKADMQYKEVASRLGALEKRVANAASKDDMKELTNRLDKLEGQNKQLKRELDDNQFFPSSRSIRPITSSDNKVRVGSSHADFNGFSSGPYTRPLAEAPRGYVEVLSDLTIAG